MERETMMNSKKRENESKEFPADILFEILSRASFQTIKRCTAVSKELKQIIYEPSFLPLHCQRTNSLYGYFFQTIINNKYKSVFISDDDHGGAAAINERFQLHSNMRILASCDQGLLCCETLTYQKHYYYICKPATAQWQALPNPKFRYETAAVAIVVVKSCPLHYNIVRLSRSGSTVKTYNCQIFDSENWAWEKIEGPNLPYLDMITPHYAGVSVGKSIHWLTINDVVLTFDVTDRSFRCSPLPEPVHCNDAYNRKQLVTYKGSLGFTCLSENTQKMELWVVEGWRWRWTRNMVIDMMFFEEILRYPNLVEFCSSDSVFMKTMDGAVFCDLRNRSLSNVEVPFTHVQQIFRFRSDFESVHLKIMKTSAAATSENISYSAYVLVFLLLSNFLVSLLVHFF